MSFLGSRRTVLRRNLPTFALLLIIGAATVWTCTADPLEDWRFSLTDSFVPNEDASRAITIVAIDNATLDRYGRFELWPRTLHAEAIRRLDDAGARVIAYDVLFSEDDEEDAAFRNAVADATVVLAVAGDGPMTIQDDGSRSFPFLVSPGANLSAVAAGIGHVNVVPDRDARVRQIPATIAADGKNFPALSAITVERFLEPTELSSPLIDGGKLTVGDLDVPLDDGLFRIAYAGNVQRFQVVSFSDVMDDSLPTSLTAGRLVVVGATAVGVDDFFQTPAGPMPGVILHANAMDALIKGRFLEVLPLAILTTIGFFAAATCAVVMTRRSLAVGAGAAVGFGVAYMVAAWLLPITGRIIDPVYVPGLMGLSLVTSLVWRFAGARAEGLFFRSWFERVAPPEIVRELRTGGIEALRAFEVGEIRLRRYQIEKELGSGATGIVYRARDVEDGRTVAIKRLYPHLARDPIARERFCAEAGILRQLHSAYIVRILDFDEEEEPPVLAMEYLPDSLDRMLAAREGEPLPALEAARIVAQISRGLADALTADVLHRDVKPSNVLLTAESIPKVTDFGLAALNEAGAADVTVTEGFRGTLRYASPEAARRRTLSDSDGVIDARSDVYSLGLVFYELLTGKPAFEGSTMMEVETARALWTLDDVEALNAFPELMEVLRRCLQEDQQSRFRDASQVMEALTSHSPNVEVKR